MHVEPAHPPVSGGWAGSKASQRFLVPSSRTAASVFFT
jgi:hypothetical protein